MTLTGDAAHALLKASETYTPCATTTRFRIQNSEIRIRIFRV